jgi:4-amino-4-deoxy-L-arabinose transferase-like glycosyltransferase
VSARRFLIAVAALSVAGAALRFSTLATQSYWSDEAVTAGLLQHGFGGMLRAIPDSESTPPLYYVLAWLWSQVFGLGEAGLRSFSALAGTLTIPVAAWLGTRAVSARAGVMCAALVAVNPLLWWYSQEARSYALVVLLAAAATAAFVSVARGGRGLWWWAALCVLALGTHYFAIFVVGPQVLWIAWTRRRRVRALAAPAVVAVAGAMLVPLLLRQASNHGADFIHASSLATRMAQVPKQFLIGFDAPAELLLTVGAGVLALLGVGLLVTRATPEERRASRLLVLVAGAGTVVPAALAVLGVDYLIARNLLPALVPALAVLAAGFAAERAGRLGVAGVAGLCALSIAAVIGVDTTSAYQRDDWRGVARQLGPPARNRVVVVTPAEGAVALQWYLPGAQTTGAPVSAAEIDMVGVGERVGGQKPKPPRPPYPTAAGFTVVRTVEAPTFTAIVTQAPAPVQMDYAFAAAQRLSPGVQAAVMYQKR